MAIITGDFETYYDKDYSLRKMTEIEYLLDPRFQLILLSLKTDDGPTEVMVGWDEIVRRLSQIDWARVAWLSHNTRFDGAILAWHLGFQPRMWLDTLGMARATTHALLGKSSLDAVSKYLGLPPKGDEVVRMMGVRLEELQRRAAVQLAAGQPNDLDAYKAYCVRDTENCKLIFDILRPRFNDDELRLIDLILRMYIEPQVKLNPTVLAEHLAEVRAKKAAVLAKVSHIDKSVFSSNQQFAALLESYGVEVPKKISKTTGLETWALARGDREFKELCMDSSQPLEVQTLLAARQNVKSTIEETRTGTLLKQSLLEWTPARPVGIDVATWDAAKWHGLVGSRGTGWAPVPLKYAGAHTLRLSGDGGVNWQNFTRGSRIRAAVDAPDGYRIVHRDASQIEARMVAFLAKCLVLLEGFALGKDVYSEFATGVYHKPVSKKTPTERHVGKTSILGLGYGMGAPRFRHTLFIGNGGPSVDITIEEAKRIVYYYRDHYKEIPALWGRAQTMMMHMASWTAATDATNRRLFAALPPMEPIPGVEPGREALWFPDGLAISYPGLRVDYHRDQTGRALTELCYNDPYGSVRRLFGGMIVENISQRLARTVVLNIAVRVYNETGYNPWMTTHDSLDYCVPASEAAAMDTLLEREFARRPDWALDLPLASEGGWGKTLLAAEKMENA